MNKIDDNEMPDGVALTARVAETIFNWLPLTQDDVTIGIKHGILPNYSESNGDAIEILNKFAERGKSISLIWKHNLGDSYFVASNYDDESMPLDGWTFEDEMVRVEATTIALALCRVGLRLWSK